MDHDEYPPLPGAELPSFKPEAEAPAAPTKPAAATQPPRQAPTKVSSLKGEITGGFGGLPHAGVASDPPPKMKAPVKTKETAPAATAPAPKAPVAGPGGAQPPGRVAASKESAKDIFSQPVQPPMTATRSESAGAAVGRMGGIPRWDDLRTRLRREPHRIEPDDPIFAQIAAMEEHEEGIIGHLGTYRQTSEALGVGLRHTEQALVRAESRMENMVLVGNELVDLIQFTLVPAIDELRAEADEVRRSRDELKAMLAQAARAAADAAAERLALPAALVVPSSPPSPLRRFGRFLFTRK